ncbi:MAG: 1-acyl-sn-glycerol-3-phosphate acyltransferase [Actinomycetota bacterium]|nr:1-acyl-sn-glycerol-3-phosphate acyltransferase [Actinomycetota bacterium]
MDLIALGAVQPLRMVAKREVRNWPVVGPLARRVGTVFVDRERLSTLPRTVATVSGALTGGAAVGAFPEGTTWCGLAGGRFRPAIFQAAVDTATAVRPVALRYRLVDADTTTAASFVGTATLWGAAVRLAGVRGLVVEVRLLPLLDPAGCNRRALATRAERAVTSVTLPLIPQPYNAYRVLGTDCGSSRPSHSSLSPELGHWGPRLGWAR